MHPIRVGKVQPSVEDEKRAKVAFLQQFPRGMATPAVESARTWGGGFFVPWTLGRGHQKSR